MKNNLLPVNIHIADRSYRLKIESEDEEMVRQTVKAINEKIIDFKTNFAGKDMQDYVAMALLWYATEQQKPTMQQAVHSESEQKLHKIEQLISKALQ